MCVIHCSVYSVVDTVVYMIVCMFIDVLVCMNMYKCICNGVHVCVCAGACCGIVQPCCGKCDGVTLCVSPSIVSTCCVHVS